MTDSTHNAAPTGPSTYLERQGVRKYVARNSRGAEVLVGDGPGRFSPGDLMKLAIAGCNAMSSDKRMTDRLGEDFEQFIGVAAEYNEEEDRFTSFEVEMVQDLSGLSEQEVKDLIRRAEGAIDRNCTIGHTIAHEVPYSKTFTSEEVGEA
ncbi:OsmC family protein [Schaalia vaccimaxillae]|uniref:OsmC family protein n=1 Tax=Schaalia vaccimaxillae TaxID=183916 RepID=UPI00047DCF3A|nr:OsmC family protein [Schaalia vaccimaxillae]